MPLITKTYPHLACLYSLSQRYIFSQSAPDHEVTEDTNQLLPHNFHHWQKDLTT